jgi:hypothetical protein
MALLPGGGLGSAERLFSLEGVDEHAAAAVFVWNQCGPCEIKARGPGGIAKNGLPKICGAPSSRKPELIMNLGYDRADNLRIWITWV